MAACVPIHEPVSGAPEKVAPSGSGKEIAGRVVVGSPDDSLMDLMARVLGDTEDVWRALFVAMRKDPYPEPRLVLYANLLASPCGILKNEIYVFYCSDDRKVYVNITRMRILSQRARSPGDFSIAFLIVHEMSHHVQNVLGTTQQFDRSIAELEGPSRAQMRMNFELQADCYAGVWAHFAQQRKIIEVGDLELGLPAALATGDAKAMPSAVGRVHWFERGRSAGDPRACDTS